MALALGWLCRSSSINRKKQSVCPCHGKVLRGSAFEDKLHGRNTQLTVIVEFARMAFLLATLELLEFKTFGISETGTTSGHRYGDEQLEGRNHTLIRLLKAFNVNNWSADGATMCVGLQLRHHSRLKLRNHKYSD